MLVYLYIYIYGYVHTHVRMCKHLRVGSYTTSLRENYQSAHSRSLVMEERRVPGTFRAHLALGHREVV